MSDRRFVEVRPINPRLLGYHGQQATHIKLVKGVVSYNPHLQVLCPTLVKGHRCSRHKDYNFFRPELLVKNHARPTLELWMCEGCKDKFLLRVEREI